jgi:hypothetical protein
VYVPVRQCLYSTVLCSACFLFLKRKTVASAVFFSLPAHPPKTKAKALLVSKSPRGLALMNGSRDRGGAFGGGFRDLAAGLTSDTDQTGPLTTEYAAI